MKRYASHFIFFPGYGYLRQYMIEAKDGYVTAISPLTEEIESVEWLPGVIALLTEVQGDLISGKHSSVFQETSLILEEIPESYRKGLHIATLKPYLFFPFNFTTMQPADGTLHRLLP
ncbi:hypothetical protein [Bacteroides sp. UBA939]|uniref:hypothetical protein n=1 Tax=Bacteroides sp. UBA939 TaxID=1946092 RepID=UPI0025BB449B|nr:hypothetical protein [Bacteroides sp. UBA939]